jgi:CheY-like chemotaxis protein
MNNYYKELLIIDDDCCYNIVYALALKRLFRSSGINVTCFTNLSEGLDYIAQTAASPDKTLIFLDISMERMDGWQVLEQLEQLPKPVRKRLDVYLITALANKHEEQRALKSSLVKQYLEKPLLNHLHPLFAERSLQLSVA